MPRYSPDESELNGSLEFDGITGHLKLPNNAKINLGEHPERSIALWFKTSDLNTRDQKQVLYEEGGAIRGLNIYLENGPALCWGLESERGRLDQNLSLDRSPDG